MSALTALLGHHPLGLALADYRRGKVYPRTKVAWYFVYAYLLTAVSLLGVAVASLGGVPFLVPVLLAAPLVVLQLAYDARNSRYEYLLVKSALAYLVLTEALGVYFLIAPAMAPYFRVTHIHLGVLGLFLSMVMGVAYWMMPRPGGLRQEGLEAVIFHTLNAGLILRVASEPWWRYSGDQLPHILSIVSGVLLLASIASFAYAMQARVKTKEMIIQMRKDREAAS